MGRKEQMIELLCELHGDHKFEIFTNFEKKKHNNPKFGPLRQSQLFD